MLGQGSVNRVGSTCGTMICPRSSLRLCDEPNDHVECSEKYARRVPNVDRETTRGRNCPRSVVTFDTTKILIEAASGFGQRAEVYRDVMLRLNQGDAHERL